MGRKELVSRRICIKHWGHGDAIGRPRLRIEIGVVAAALLTENHENDPAAEHWMEGHLCADISMRGGVGESVMNI